MVVSDIYFNILMTIFEEITFQINSSTFIFLGKDVVIKGEVQSRPLPGKNCKHSLKYSHMIISEFTDDHSQYVTQVKAQPS